MKSEFDRLGLTFTRVSAVDASAFSDQDVRRFSERYPRSGSPTYVAVLLSHMKVWRLIADGDDEWAGVYEDDVHFAESVHAILNAPYTFPIGADVVRLETTLQSMRLGPRISADVPSPFVLVHDGAWGAAAYLLRKETARWLVAAPNRYHETPDWMLFHASSPVARGLTVFQADPAPCVQDQYLPIVGQRHAFAMATQPNRYRLLRDSLRRAVGPVYRRLRGRRIVRWG